MKKAIFIGMCIALLAAGGSIPALGQDEISADQMTVGHASANQDTVPDITGKSTADVPEKDAADVQAREAADVPEKDAADIPTMDAADLAAIDAADGVAMETLAGERSENMDAAEFEAAERVGRIWKEIDQSSVTTDRSGDGTSISPWSFSTSVGTSFISFPQVGSAMNMYAAPQLNFSASERLGFHAGVSVGRTIPVAGLVSDENMMNAGMTNISAYVAASYLLTENLVLHGSGSRNVYMLPVSGELQAVQFNDLSIGATYNFGNFSIGASIHHSDAPVFGSPFGRGNNMYGTPIFW